MMRLLWKEGRLSWPPVVLAIFSAVWILAFDYAWRLIEMPFEVLLTVGLALWSIGVLVILVASRRLR